MVRCGHNRHSFGLCHEAFPIQVEGGRVGNLGAENKVSILKRHGNVWTSVIGHLNLVVRFDHKARPVESRSGPPGIRFRPRCTDTGTTASSPLAFACTSRYSGCSGILAEALAPTISRITPSFFCDRVVSAKVFLIFGVCVLYRCVDDGGVLEGEVRRGAGWEFLCGPRIG